MQMHDHRMLTSTRPRMLTMTIDQVELQFARFGFTLNLQIQMDLPIFNYWYQTLPINRNGRLYIYIRQQ